MQKHIGYKFPDRQYHRTESKTSAITNTDNEAIKQQIRPYFKEQNNLRPFSFIFKSEI